MWLGPPCMKSEIIAFACGRSGGVFAFKSNDCGWRGMLGGVARRFSSRNSQASATLPTPMALRARKRRRDQNRIASAECAVIFMSVGYENGRSQPSGQFKTVQAGYRTRAGKHGL